MARPLLIGATIYGDDYLDRFFRFCLPSLMTEGNLGILMKTREVRIVIHTDKAGEKRFDGAFPVICDVDGSNKYDMIGRHEHQDLAIAKEKGADYHLLLPDFVYSDNCFAGVLKAVERGHKAISRLVVSTVQETIAPHLVLPRNAIELATLSLQHIHPGVRHWLVDEEGLPNNHVLAWQTIDRLRMCSPHQTLVYIANEVIRPDNSNLPLDCILDRIIDGPIYCPQPEDEICIIELSPRDSRQPNDKHVDLKEFVRIMDWDTKGSKAQQELFLQETVDAIEANGEWNDIEISEQKSIIAECLGLLGNLSPQNTTRS